MTPKEAFKIGFLQKCAADKLSLEQTLERIRHAKFMLTVDMQEKRADGSTLSALWNTFWPLALLAPPTVGLGAGYMAAQASNQPYSAEDMRKREELAEYRRALEDMQRIYAKQQAREGV